MDVVESVQCGDLLSGLADYFFFPLFFSLSISLYVCDTPFLMYGLSQSIKITWLIW